MKCIPSASHLINPDAIDYGVCVVDMIGSEYSRSEKIFWKAEIEYKYKMSRIQVALGLAQAEHNDELVERKRQIISWCRKNLQSFKGIMLNH
jgi:dTDP-4-amino-4,6-dideoxygalactose transaminase